MLGRVSVATVLYALQMLTNERLELLLLLLVPSDADKKRRPQAHCVLSGAGCEGSGS